MGDYLDRGRRIHPDTVSWACLDCGWEWPRPGDPGEDAECDNCGGELWWAEEGAFDDC